MHRTDRPSRKDTAGGARWTVRIGAGLLAVAIALPGPSATAAQAAGPDARGAGHERDAAHPHREQHMAQLAEVLELNAEQRAQVAAILREAAETGRAAWREARADGADAGIHPGPEPREALHETRRAQLSALRDDVRERLAEVLTPAQMSELDALREGRREARAEQRDARRERRFERLSEALELHPDQQEPVRDLLAQSRARSAATLREGRASGLDREALRAELERLRTETETGLGAILTPAQMERMNALREARAAKEGMGPRGEHGAHPRGRTHH